MGDPYSYIREGEDIVCSSRKATGGCLSTPGSSIGKSITKTERLELDNGHHYCRDQHNVYTSLSLRRIRVIVQLV